MTGRRLDTVVVGASLAGSAAALVLARSGARVAVVDKAIFPRPKTCGELLSPDGVAALARLGLDGEVRAAGAATIRRFALVRPDGGRVRGRLPAPALSLSRERLDAIVLDGARASRRRLPPRRGGDVGRGKPRRRLHREDPGADTRGADGPRRLGALLAARRPPRPPVLRSARDALRVQEVPRSASAGARLADHVVLHVFRGGYLGLSLVEEGRVSLGALATPAVAQEAHHDFDRLLARLSAESPALAADLAGLAPEPGPALVSEPVHLGARGAAWGDVLLAGDAAGVVDPYTGSGMALALRTGEAAGALLAEHAAGRVAAAALASEWARRWRAVTGSVFFFSRLFRPVFLGGFATRLVVPATAPLAGLAARLTRGSV